MYDMLSIWYSAWRPRRALPGSGSGGWEGVSWCPRELE